MLQRTCLVILALGAAWLWPGDARAGDLQLKLPAWAVDQPPAESAAEQRGTEEPPHPPTARKAPPARPRVVRPAPSPDPRAGEVVRERAAFSALKLFRVHQGAMRICDRRAFRRAQGPPPRIRFTVRVDARGRARVALQASRHLDPAVQRCYRTLAGSWPYPATGTAYTLELSRISTRR